VKNIAYVFPGQGSQKVGMGKELYDNYDVARDAFNEANEALGFDLAKLCFEGPKDELKDTANCQPAIITHSQTLVKLISMQLLPRATVLFSLGPYWSLGVHCCSQRTCSHGSVSIMFGRCL